MKKILGRRSMRVQSFTAAVIVAVAGLAGMAAISVEAATNLNSSRSNNYRLIASAADEVACISAGGTVVLQNRKKVCSMPAPAINLNSSKSN